MRQFCALRQFSAVSDPVKMRSVLGNALVSHLSRTPRSRKTAEYTARRAPLSIAYAGLAGVKPGAPQDIMCAQGARGAVMAFGGGEPRMPARACTFRMFWGSSLLYTVLYGRTWAGSRPQQRIGGPLVGVSRTAAICGCREDLGSLLTRRSHHFARHFQPPKPGPARQASKVHLCPVWPLRAIWPPRAIFFSSTTCRR
eukprot:IDg2583t1